jgi:tryptophan synthase beta subunit
MSSDNVILVNLSGRGDKDLATVVESEAERDPSLRSG